MSRNEHTAKSTLGLDDFNEDVNDATTFLTFMIAGECYAIAVQHVVEIVGLQKITLVPDVSDCIRGVINLRGKVIPVMDVRLRFHLQQGDYNERSCIIVVDVKGVAVGLLVDTVNEVLDMPNDSVEAAPSMGSGKLGNCVQGIGKHGDSVKLVLDIDKLLSIASPMVQPPEMGVSSAGLDPASAVRGGRA